MSIADQLQQPYRAGDIVYTLYGAGVIVATEPFTTSTGLIDTKTDNGHDRTSEVSMSNSEKWYTVRLWRIPNRSIGSSTVATLRSAVVRRSLPVPYDFTVSFTPTYTNIRYFLRIFRY